MLLPTIFLSVEVLGHPLRSFSAQIPFLFFFFKHGCVICLRSVDDVSYNHPGTAPYHTSKQSRFVH